MRTWKWYALWWIFFTNITCGIGLLAVVSPMAQDVIGMAPPEAASFVGIIGVVNGGGVFSESTVSDWIGRGMTYIIFFAFEVFAFYRLSEITDSFVFQFLVLAVISCYGGGFSCMPAFLSDIFGVRQLAAIHGSILTAWGIAGIAGSVILALMKEATGSYSATLSLFRECLPLLSLFLYSFIGKMKRSGRSGAYLPEIIDLSVYETMTEAFVRVSVPFISIIGGKGNKIPYVQSYLLQRIFHDGKINLYL